MANDVSLFYYLPCLFKALSFENVGFNPFLYILFDTTKGKLSSQENVFDIITRKKEHRFQTRYNYLMEHRHCKPGIVHPNNVHFQFYGVFPSYHKGRWDSYRGISIPEEKEESISVFELTSCCKKTLQNIFAPVCRCIMGSGRSRHVQVCTNLLKIT